MALKNVAHFQPRLQLAPRPIPSEKLNKSIKVGESSFMVCETTHRNIDDLAAELRNTHLGTMRFVLDTATPILLDKQRGMAESNAEHYGVIITSEILARLRKVQNIRSNFLKKETSLQELLEMLVKEGEMGFVGRDGMSLEEAEEGE